MSRLGHLWSMQLCDSYNTLFESNLGYQYCQGERVHIDRFFQWSKVSRIETKQWFVKRLFLSVFLTYSHWKVPRPRQWSFPFPHKYSSRFSDCMNKIMNSNSIHLVRILSHASSPTDQKILSYVQTPTQKDNRRKPMTNPAMPRIIVLQKNSIVSTNLYYCQWKEIKTSANLVSSN